MSEGPGRPPEEESSSRKTELSSDAKIILALLKKQPQTRDELCENTGIKDRTFYRMDSFLQDSNIIKCVDGMYALWNFEFLEKQIEDVFRRFLSERQVVYSTFLVNELGKPWLQIEAATYKVAKKLGLEILPDGMDKMFFKGQ